ncbi:hypothetical protein LCGC14_0460250 [marine sediment metagenome]|uniref:Uncharacterized protein n=1 Tax=marine sediment metagenome TaxID=412755 RepID=A0A0F9SFB6_9ZZZZ
MPSQKEMRAWLRGDKETSYGRSISVESINKSLADDPLAAVVDASGWRVVNAMSGEYSVSLDGKDALLNFGKHAGARVSELAADESDRSYLEWMLKSDFVAELLGIVKVQLERDLKAQAAGWARP